MSLWSSPGCGGCGCVCVHPRWIQPAPCEPRCSWCSGSCSSARDQGSRSDYQLQRDRKHRLSVVHGTFTKKKAVVTPPLYNVTTSLKQKKQTRKKEVISFLYQQLAKVVGSFQAHIGILCISKIHITREGLLEPAELQ